MSDQKFTGKAIDKYEALTAHVRDCLEWKDGSIVEKEKGSVLFGSLPEGLTRETVEQYKDHHNNVVNALSIVMPEMVTTKMKEDPNLARVKGTVNMGKADSVTLTMDRERFFPIPGTDKKSHKHMHISISEKIGGRGLKAVQEEVSNRFKEVLGL